MPGKSSTTPDGAPATVLFDWYLVCVFFFLFKELLVVRSLALVMVIDLVVFHE